MSDETESVKTKPKGKPGRPFGTSDADLMRNANFDKLFKEGYFNIRENRRSAKRLLKRSLAQIKDPVDFVTMGSVVSKFLEQITQCDRLMIELAKMKKEESGGYNNGAMNRDDMFDAFEGKDDVEPKE